LRHRREQLRSVGALAAISSAYCFAMSVVRNTVLSSSIQEERLDGFGHPIGDQ
jgi:hypothetical protein